MLPREARIALHHLQLLLMTREGIRRARLWRVVKAYAGDYDRPDPLIYVKGEIRGARSPADPRTGKVRDYVPMRPTDRFPETIGPGFELDVMFPFNAGRTEDALVVSETGLMSIQRVAVVDTDIELTPEDRTGQ